MIRLPTGDGINTSFNIDTTEAALTLPNVPLAYVSRIALHCTVSWQFAIRYPTGINIGKANEQITGWTTGAFSNSIPASSVLYPFMLDLDSLPKFLGNTAWTGGPATADLMDTLVNRLRVKAASAGTMYVNISGSRRISGE